MGKWLIFFGVILIIAGILVIYGVSFSWVGNLPGDFKIKTGSSVIYIPLTTGILISIVLTLILYLFRLVS